MRHFQAVTGFVEDELPLFEATLAFLANDLAPDVQEARFDRIISISGLPDLRQLAPGIDVDRLLELRARREWTDFRTWLRNIDGESDAEIAAAFTDLGAHAASALNSVAGKTVRILIGSAIGVGGFLEGLAASVVDSFLVERLIGRPGPAAFIGRWYPSIFRENEAGVSDG